MCLGKRRRLLGGYGGGATFAALGGQIRHASGLSDRRAPALVSAAQRSSALEAELRGSAGHRGAAVRNRRWRSVGAAGVGMGRLRRRRSPRGRRGRLALGHADSATSDLPALARAAVAVDHRVRRCDVSCCCRVLGIRKSDRFNRVPRRRAIGRVRRNHGAVADGCCGDDGGERAGRCDTAQSSTGSGQVCGVARGSELLETDERLAFDLRPLVRCFQGAIWHGVHGLRGDDSEGGSRGRRWWGEGVGVHSPPRQSSS